MRLFISTIILSLAVSFAAIAQDPVKDADNLLAKVSKKYKSYSSIKADFTLNIKSPEGEVDDTQKGTVFIKGDKYMLDMKGQKVYNNGETVWTYLEDAEEVTVSDFEPEEGSISPNDLFTIYEKDFLYRMADKATENGKTYQVVELTPNDKSLPYFKIKLFIDEAQSQILKARVFDKNGNKYTYEIKSFNPNTSLDDSYFVFNKNTHPDVDVIDLR